MIGGEETRWERKRSIGASKSHSGPIIRRVSHTHVATTQVGRSQRHSWATTFWRQLSPLMKNNQLPQFITLHMIPPLFFFLFFFFFILLLMVSRCPSIFFKRSLLPIFEFPSVTEWRHRLQRFSPPLPMSMSPLFFLDSLISSTPICFSFVFDDFYSPHAQRLCIVFSWWWAT